MQDDQTTRGTLGGGRAGASFMLPVGSPFAGYRIAGVAGSGGMGVVYRAVDETLGRFVAIKLIAPEYADDAAFREMFLREAQRAASIEHPNILPIYASGTVDAHLYLAMRFVEGVTAAELVRATGPLDPSLAVRIVTDVAGALDALHKRNVVHRDVKPGNIMLSAATAGDPRSGDAGAPADARDWSNAHVYLTDFGLSDVVAQDATSQSPLGTPGYGAPEQRDGRAVDARTDVYSLGCVLSFLLTGHPPADDAKTPASVPARLADVIRTAVADDPGERYPRATDLAAAGRDALAGDTASAGTLRRRRRASLVALAGAVLAIAVVAISLSSRNGAARERNATLADRLVDASQSPQNMPPERRILLAREAFVRAGDAGSEQALRQNLQDSGLAANESANLYASAEIKATGDDRVLIGRRDGPVELWGPFGSTEPAARTEVAEASVSPFAAVSTTMTIAARGVVTVRDDTLQLWEPGLRDPRLLGRIPGKDYEVGLDGTVRDSSFLLWNRDTVWEASTDPDGGRRAVATGVEIRKARRIPNGRGLVVLALDSLRIVSPGEDTQTVLRIEEPYDVLTSTDGSVIAVPSSTGIVIVKHIRGRWSKQRVIPYETSLFRSLPAAMTNAGDFVAAARDNGQGTVITSTLTGEIVFETSANVRGLAFADSRHLVGVGPQGIVVWEWRTDGADRRRIDNPVAPGGILPTTDGRATLIAATGDVSVWPTGVPPELRLRGTDPITAVAAAPDGRAVLIGEANGLITAHDRSGKQIAATDLPAAIAWLAVSRSGEHAIALLTDGRVFDGAIRQGRIQLREGADLPDATAVAMSPDGTTRAIGSASGEVLVVDTAGTRLVGRHRGAVTALAFSPDGTLVASGSEDRTAVVWDADGEAGQIATLGLNPAGIRALAFSHDGSHVVTGDASGATVWDARRGQRLVNFVGEVEHLAVTGPGPAFVAASSTRVTFFRCTACQPRSELLAAVTARAGRDLTADERRDNGIPANDP